MEEATCQVPSCPHAQSLAQESRHRPTVRVFKNSSGGRSGPFSSGDGPPSAPSAGAPQDASDAHEAQASSSSVQSNEYLAAMDVYEVYMDTFKLCEFHVKSQKDLFFLRSDLIFARFECVHVDLVNVHGC